MFACGGCCIIFGLMEGMEGMDGMDGMDGMEMGMDDDSIMKDESRLSARVGKESQGDQQS